MALKDTFDGGYEIDDRTQFRVKFEVADNLYYSGDGSIDLATNYGIRLSSIPRKALRSLQLSYCAIKDELNANNGEISGGNVIDQYGQQVAYISTSGHISPPFAESTADRGTYAKAPTYEEIEAFKQTDEWSKLRDRMSDFLVFPEGNQLTR